MGKKDIILIQRWLINCDSIFFKNRFIFKTDNPLSMHLDSSKLVSFPLISSLFSHCFIYSFIYLVIVELLSDTNALIQRKTLKISQKTDSRTENRAKLVKTRVERKRKAKNNVCVDAKRPRSWVCKVNGVSSEWVCVWVDMRLHGFLLAVLRSNQAKRKSLSVCRQRIGLLNIHPAPHVVQKRMSKEACLTP